MAMPRLVMLRLGVDGLKSPGIGVGLEDSRSSVVDEGMTITMSSHFLEITARGISSLYVMIWVTRLTRRSCCVDSQRSPDPVYKGPSEARARLGRSANQRC